MIVNEIKIRRSRFLACEICQEQREHNFEAHNIARMATRSDVGLRIWLSSPPSNVCIPRNILE